MRAVIALVLCVCATVPMLACKTASPRQQDEVLFPILQHRKLGYIDRQGTVVIAPQFDNFSYWWHNVRSYSPEMLVVMYAARFSEGLAAVYKRGDGWGYIDRTGTLVIAAQFDVALYFWEGRAAVAVGDKWGYIDRTGKYVWGPSE